MIYLNSQQKNQSLWQDYQQQKANNPLLFPTEGAKALSVSEFELLLSSPDSCYMGSNCRDVLQQLSVFNQLESIVRNEYAVHEKQGQYQNLILSETTGIMINIGGLDLRYFIDKWQHMLAITDLRNPEKPSYSIQFFDDTGNAINKIFLRDLSKNSINCWLNLINNYASSSPVEIILQSLIKPTIWQCYQLTSHDKKSLHDKWLSMTDIHQFYHILKNLNIDRTSSYHQAPENMTVQLKQNCLLQLLEKIRDNQCPVMIFVGNTGVVQIQTGTIKHIKSIGDWLNILDNSHNYFTLHVKERAISQLWCVKRPTSEGIVTCIEGFDSYGRSIFTIFGERQERKKELDIWRSITNEMIENFAFVDVRNH